jgi:dTDP-4-dehydrorhamnose 3,5-epimerase
MVNNPTRGTLRGLHFQKQPFTESKIIQCVSGKVFDVIVDIRKNSKNFLKKIEIEIGPNCKFQGLIIPKGFAHGYLTLSSNTSIVYFMDAPYSLEHARGLRWDDVSLEINWPIEPHIISKVDTNWPIFNHINGL